MIGERDGWRPLIEGGWEVYGRNAGVQNGDYPAQWTPFENRAWYELKKLNRNNGLSLDEVIVGTNRVLAEVIRRGKTPLHPLRKNGALLLRARFSRYALNQEHLTTPQREALGHILTYQEALQELESNPLT